MTRTQMAGMGRGELERALLDAEAKLNEQKLLTSSYATDLSQMERERDEARAKLARVVEALADARIRLDQIGWELEKPGIDREQWARIVHAERDLCDMALAAAKGE